MIEWLSRFWFLLLISFAAVEYLVALLAPGWYFRTGLPVCRRQYLCGALTAGDLVARITHRAPNRILLRALGASGFGLREHFGFYLLYSALLHWQLLPSRAGDGWVLVARYKVYALLLDVVLVGFWLGAGRLGVVGIPFVAFGMLITASIAVLQMSHVRFLYEVLVPKPVA